MTATPAPATPPPPDSGGSRRRRIMLLAIVVGVLAVMSVPLISTRTPQEQSHNWRYDDQISYRFLKLATDTDSEINLTPFYKRWFHKFPEPVRSPMQYYLGRTWHRDYHVTDIWQHRNHLTAVFEVQFPSVWKQGKNSDNIPVKLDEYLQKLPQVYMRVRQGEWSAGLMNDGTSYSNAPQLHNVRPAADRFLVQVPVEKKHLTPFTETFSMDFFEVDLRSVEKFKHLHTFELPNPFYQATTPLTGAVTLPAHVTHDGVTVTLKGLGLDANTTSSAAFVAMWPPKIFSSTPADRRYDFTRMDFEVKQEGAPVPHWRVGRVHGLAAVENVPVLQNEITQTTNAQYSLKLSGDLADLKQPVKLQFELMRASHYSPDEQMTLQIPLPKKGQAISGKNANLPRAKLWDHTPRVYGVSWAAEFKYPSNMKSSDTALEIGLAGTTETLELSNWSLMEESGEPEPLTNYWNPAGSGRSTAGESQIRFMAKDDSMDITAAMERFTTLSVTLTSPRIFPSKFEFIVDPGEAPQ